MGTGAGCEAKILLPPCFVTVLPRASRLLGVRIPSFPVGHKQAQCVQINERQLHQRTRCRLKGVVAESSAWCTTSLKSVASYREQCESENDEAQ